MCTDSSGPTALDDLSGLVDRVRIEAARDLDPARRGALGQFFTPAPVARLVASLSAGGQGAVRLLDAGAGVGVLSAAWIARACASPVRPASVELVAYELDASLVPPLRRVLDLCARFAGERGVSLGYEVREADFIGSAGAVLSGEPFDAAILNPPYRKLRADSRERRLLRGVGIEAGNLYTAFVALALRALRDGGELIAITPRSFCSGPYFTPFRKDLLRRASLSHLHLFEARDEAFGDSGVLQESLVFRAERGRSQAPSVVVGWSRAGEAGPTTRREVPSSCVVHPDDPDAVIHITPDEQGGRVAEVLRALPGTLSGLGVQVSTGRVVDFRVREHLRADPGEGTVPLIYPAHLSAGGVVWPRPGGRKPDALLRAPSTEGLLHPAGVYVLVRRFSAKEERRRLVASVLTPEAVPGEAVAFENHLNCFHRGGQGLPRALAFGLAAWLNSTVVDAYFRQFSGHTQVNAADLRKLPYPSAAQLERLAARLGSSGSDAGQERLDASVEAEILDV